MNAFLAQMFLLGRGNDVEGWMDILVLVVVAAVYGLGVIIRAKGKKAKEQTREQANRKPERKPAAGGRGVLEQFFREIQQVAEGKPARETRPAGQTARKQTARPQAAVRKYAAEVKQSSHTHQITAPVTPKRPGLELSKPIPQVQPHFEKLPELDTGIQALPDFTGKAVAGLKGKRKGMPAEAVESRYLSEVLADYYEDPDELKSAILHYEILGRPLALRDPSGQIIGL
jgi:hypothetical protein